MCSIVEDDFGDEGGVHSMQPALEALNINELSGICPKCNEEPVAVKLNYKEAQCKTCFLAYVRHKFRATLGSSRVLPKNAEVLLVFDGNPCSVTLLDMAHYAQTQNTFKRLHCNLKGLVVYDSFLGHQEPNYLERVLEITASYNISWYYTSLASNEPPLELNGQNVNNLKELSKEEEHQLKDTLESFKSLTCKQDFLSNLRKNVIRNAAVHLDCRFVFLSDICPDLATTFLANISLGRGCSTALDIGLVDDRLSNLKLIRPLKDLTETDVQYYITFNNLPTVQHKLYGDEADSMASIQNLTKSFVENLQEKFPSTVFTVFRTGNKIAAKNRLEMNDSQDVCRLCRSVLSSDDSKTLFAIEFSRIVSEFAADGLEDMTSLEAKAQKQMNSDRGEQLCHACRYITKDTNGEHLALDSYF